MTPRGTRLSIRWGARCRSSAAGAVATSNRWWTTTTRRPVATPALLGKTSLTWGCPAGDQLTSSRATPRTRRNGCRWRPGADQLVAGLAAEDLEALEAPVAVVRRFPVERYRQLRELRLASSAPSS